MKKHRFNVAAIGFIILIVLVVVVLMSGSLRRTSHVALPDITQQSAANVGSSQYGEDAVNKIEVTPETVQAVIATLARPNSYMQLLVVEWLWGDTSALSQVSTYVSEDLTRVDLLRTDGKVRHIVTDGKHTAVWYDEEETAFVGNTGDISVDQEQTIPTYEDILQLDPKQIAKADYRMFSGENCIFVETVPDDLGIIQRYWVSVSAGLLVGAERLENGSAFYRVASQQLTTENAPAESLFKLPDGTDIRSYGSES